MGAWGTAIFSDDTALDVRGDWRDAILEGLSAEEATEQLKASFSETLADEDESKIFWLALAAAQMETGRLLPDVRDQALALIAAGGDVDRWAEDDPSLAGQRQRVLERLGEKLRAPQPAPKKIRPPRVLAIPFDLGDVVHVRDPEKDAEALFVVVDQAEGVARGEFHPVLSALFWEGGEVPSEKELHRLPFLVTDEPIGKQFRPHLIVATTNRKDSVFGAHIGEVVARGVVREPPGDYRRGALERRAKVVTSWMEWQALVRWVGGASFRHEMEITQSRGRGRGRAWLRRRS